MKCLNCEKATHQHKVGKTKAGSQRFRCSFCKGSYTPEKKAQGYSKAFRQKAIRMYVDGAGLRRTGRQLGVHHQSVANWAKVHAEQLLKAPMPDKVKAAEFDELFTFIGDKKTEFTLLHL
jgi:transposase-like protein